MIYPTLTDNFNLATLNANFLELYNQINVKQSYTPTASNLGTINTHLAIVKSGIVRYKLRANSGTWVADTEYVITTLDNIYRPANNIEKCIVLRNGLQAYLYIGTNGLVRIVPFININNYSISIDETYII